ncbi:MAG TPA: hypothetical protein VG937_14600 [Polyangiaceae bacterium]|jgi:hypothetical protein|nr:hypothetical protein [Polyangiaceae bacterium]
MKAPSTRIGRANRRGIEVLENVLRAETWAMFEQFAASGRPVYNGRGG